VIAFWQVFPVCSFWGERPVAIWYEGPNLTIERESARQVRSEEAWCACAACAELVRADNRERIARRAAHRGLSENVDAEARVSKTRQWLDLSFRNPRDSPAFPGLS